MTAGHDTQRRCAICGRLIEGESKPIKGVFGKGVQHADTLICMEAVGFGADDYEPSDG